MQIKTGITLIGGIALGYCFFRDADKKEKALIHVKRVLYKIQTGKELPTTDVPKHTTYKEYFKNNEPRPYFRQPEFDSKEEAQNVLDEMIDIAKKYKSVSVSDMIVLTNGTSAYIPYTWKNWGWYADDMSVARVEERRIEYDDTKTMGNKWIITNLCPVRRLDY